MWVKFTKKDGAGYHSFKYVYFDDDTSDDFIEDYSKELVDEEYWNHLFRGVEWKKIAAPPLEFLQKEQKETECRIKGQQKYLEKLKEAIKVQETFL